MIDRRSFVTAASLAAVTGSARAQTPRKTGAVPEHYELRRYQLRNGPGAKIVGDYLAELVPALTRAGVRHIGVFQTMIGPDMPTSWLLVPYETPGALAIVEKRIAADAAFQRSAATAAYQAASAEKPAYVRLDSSLLMAMTNMPRLVPPAIDKPRIFELRTYESASEAASARKQEMFTKLGETEIFRRVGLTPVFFGRTLIGLRQPSFTYLLTYADLAARQKAWEAFGADPEWQKLRATPGYSDAELVSNITGVILRPAAQSQV